MRWRCAIRGRRDPDVTAGAAKRRETEAQFGARANETSSEPLAQRETRSGAPKMTICALQFRPIAAFCLLSISRGEMLMENACVVDVCALTQAHLGVARHHFHFELDDNGVPKCYLKAG